MFNAKKLLLYPAVVWVVIYLFICILIGFKINTSADWVMMATTLISIVGLFYAAKIAGIKDFKKALLLGLVWVLVMVVLDLILTMPFVPGYFSNWKTYFSYGITFLMPIIVSFIK